MHQKQVLLYNSCKANSCSTTTENSTEQHYEDLIVKFQDLKRHGYINEAERQLGFLDL